MEGISNSKVVDIETFLFICQYIITFKIFIVFIFVVEILIQEPSDYFLHDFRSFDKMEIFCLINLELEKFHKEELSKCEISYIQALEYIKVNSYKILMIF